MSGFGVRKFVAASHGVNQALNSYEIGIGYSEAFELDHSLQARGDRELTVAPRLCGQQKVLCICIP